MSKETIKISGMTCAACAQRVQKAVGKVEGVSDANVNFATEKLTVEFDEQVASIPIIRDAVEKAGYGVIEDSKLNNVTIPIGGMTCAACAQRVEKAIAKLEGIHKVSVNLATEKATVEYDSQVIRLSAIKQCIEKTGYKALEIDKNTVDEDKIRKEKEIKILWTKFTIAAVFGVPLLYFAMVSMVSWWPFPIPKAINPMFTR
jgi:Cu+-exporting ATPase